MIDYELLKTEAEKIGVPLDNYALDRFDLFAEQLVKWNTHVNLTAITEPEEIVRKHFLDCLYILKYIVIPPEAQVIDVGCGAGFPGMPLLFAQPNIQVTFVDSLHKRLGFIKEVLRASGLCAERVHERAELLGRDAEYRDAFDYATARAVAPLNVLCEYCMPLVKPGGLFIAMKGSEDESEAALHAIAELGGKLEDNVSFELPTGEKRHIVVIRKISQTPTKYPRRTKKITAFPL